MDKMTMAHEYIVACLRSGKKLDDINIHVAYKMAIDLEKTHKSNENKSRPDVLADEWQPDWSYAPSWANWWCMESSEGFCYWTSSQPSKKWNKFSIVRNEKASPFDYKGEWQDSLRERPEVTK